MKKVLKVMMVLMFCVFTAFGVSACGKAKIESATVKNGTLETVIVKGEELDTSNTIVVYTYSDNSKKEVSSSELSFSAIDTNTIAEQTLTITYEKENYSFDVAINVVASEADVNSIDQLESGLLNNYNSKRLANSSVESTFMDSDQVLYVGNDNKLDFQIIASGTDGAGNEVDNIQKVRTNIVVEVKESGDYRQLEGAELASTVTIDTENTTLKFADSVVDKEFRITVTAVNANPDYEEYTYFIANIKVIDGYNVYEAKELSLYDNQNKDGVWTSKKEQWGLDGISPNALILQKDISITVNDVPAEYFWTTDSANYQTVRDKVGSDYFLGTPIDTTKRGLYNRKASNGSTFNFIGNYFQVDLSQFPKMVIENDNATTDTPGPSCFGYVNTTDEAYMTAHLCVFFTSADDSEINSETVVNWKNFNFNGNGSQSATPENSGAILLMKNKVVNFNAYNTLMNNFYIGYFLESGNTIDNIEAGTTNDYIGQFVVDSCKGYYSYQCLFYFYGAEHVVIKNSEFKEAGGPAIIANQVWMDNGNVHTGNVSTVDIINSTIESHVTANSFWFSMYGVNAFVGQIADADQLYTGVNSEGQSNGLADTGKTIIAETKDGQPVLNALGIILASNSLAPCQGYIRVFESETDYNNYYDADPNNNPSVYGLDLMSTTTHVNGYNFADIASSQGVNFFESNESGGFINSGVGSNGMMSTLGTIYADGLYDAIQSFVNAEMPQYLSYVTVEGFKDKTFAEKQGALNEILGVLASQGYLDVLYTQGQSQGLFEEVSGWSDLDNNAKLSALTGQINSWTSVSYAEGDYINLYTSMGVGAVFALYDNE